jgi:hypothetical protein
MGQRCGASEPWGRLGTHLDSAEASRLDDVGLPGFIGFLRRLLGIAAGVMVDGFENMKQKRAVCQPKQESKKVSSTCASPSSSGRL